MAGFTCSEPIVFAQHPKKSNFVDITGLVYGRLTVLGYAGKRSAEQRTYWYCRCDCGTLKVICGHNLKQGKSHSCGCLQRELVSKRLTIHGQSRKGKQSSEYSTYKGAKERCNNQKHEHYAYYGGRGIEFRFESFAGFLSCIGSRPSARHTLDRVDNNGHYEPGNVRWATLDEQANNTRKNIIVTIDGTTQSLSQWLGCGSKYYGRAQWLMRVKGLSPSDAVADALSKKSRQLKGQ